MYVHRRDINNDQCPHIEKIVIFQDQFNYFIYATVRLYNNNNYSNNK